MSAAVVGAHEGSLGTNGTAPAVSRWPISPTWIAVVFYVVNVAAIVSGIASGHRKGDLAIRFQEKQSITFLSSNQLAMTACVAAAIYLMRRHVLGRRAGFWLLSAFGFLFLMLDESFQFHEGIDSRLFELVGAGGKNPRIDGLSTALYGLGAFAVCWIFRADILRFRPTFGFFCTGAVFLAATSALNFGDAPAWQVVLEESCKLLGVCSFFLGFLSALLGTIAETQPRVTAVTGARPPSARAREPLHAP
jgi:hypothetical protein